MSGILKHKKRFAAVLILILVVGILTVFWVNQHLNYIALFLIYLLIIIAICLNEATRRKIWKIRRPFYIHSDIRNVDYLVIGDMCNPEDFVPVDKTYVQILAPGRGFRSAYQVLRHTHSILKEDGGTVIMPCGNSDKEFTVFDIPFLHPITIKKYHLENLRMKSNVPIFFAPIASIHFLTGKGLSHIYTAKEDIDSELLTFCEERNYLLQCFIKQ